MRDHHHHYYYYIPSIKDEGWWAMGPETECGTQLLCAISIQCIQILTTSGATSHWRIPAREAFAIAVTPAACNR